MNSNVAAIVLAAGKGTRMNATDRNKVTFELANKPMIAYTVDHLQEAGINTIIAVVGFARESVEEALGERVVYAEQTERLGTGHAVKVGLTRVPQEIDCVITLYGDDSAFYPPSIFQELIKRHLQSSSVCTLMTINKTDPTGLGRIVRDEEGNVVEIVEEKNATDEQRKITEINTGLYCFHHDFIKEAINKIEVNPVSQEYYLTDVVAIAQREGKKVEALVWEDDSIWFGVNTPEQYESAKLKMDQLIL